MRTWMAGDHGWGWRALRSWSLRGTSPSSQRRPGKGSAVAHGTGSAGRPEDGSTEQPCMLLKNDKIRAELGMEFVPLTQTLQAQGEALIKASLV